ncbi:MAG: WD40/YVTN/BNR-like repeat-containing protein, partial [Usitatibacter sp.]
MNQIRLRGAQALATAFVSISTFALAQPADVMGPPLVTVNGCHSDQIFTRAYVAKAIGVDEGTVRRMLSRYAITPSQACVLEPDALKTLVAHTRTNKFGFDEPESAIAYRKLSYLDESGDIRPNGLGIAIQQRQDNVRASSLKGAISPKAAGVTSASWTALGPFNAGGRVRAIAPHPTIANRILVGGVSGGIWKSVNGGGSWTPVNDFMASVAISCLIHDPNNASVVYACTGEGAFNTDAIRGLGLFKSIDAGDTWTQVASTNPGTAPVGGTSWYYVNRLAIDPSNSLVMLAATNGGVYRTADGGATWTAVYGNSSPVRRVYDVKFNTTTARGALGTQAVLGEHRYFDGAQFNGGA